MKLSWSFFASSLSCTALAARPSLSPDTARLVIAQRLGLSRFHSLEHADAEAIRHINAFGGQSQQLFGHDDSDKSKSHLFVWIDGVEEDVATVVVSDHAGHIKDFGISSPPSASSNDRLVKDIISQVKSLPKPADPQQSTYQTNLKIDAAIAPHTGLQLYNDYLSVWRVQNKELEARGSIETVLARLQKDGLDGAFTVVMMPARPTSSKRSVDTWGSYHVPAVRQNNVEAFLSAGPEPASSPAPPVSDLEDFPVIVNQADSKGPVRGILPKCFSSKSACQKTTHNCTGHGECTLLHKGRSEGGSQQSIDCYGCACKATVEHVVEDKGMEIKKKVTYWGGPACQKKDISVQFWLFVGTGVVLAFLVASGIGMLYSMGSEELPSVIGAGVSGPARK